MTNEQTPCSAAWHDGSDARPDMSPTKRMRSPCRILYAGAKSVTSMFMQAVLLSCMTMEPDAFRAFSALSGTKNGYTDILDSGASRHFCNDVNRFDKGSLITANSKAYVRTANGARVRIRAYGTMTLRMADIHGTIREIKLMNVAFVPEFGHTLISVRRLWRDNGIKTKFGDKCVLKSLEGHKFVVHEQDNLYSVASYNATDGIDANILHARMGHCGIEKLKLLAGRSTGLDLPHDLKFDECEACRKGGARRHPFHASDQSVRRGFGDKISSDLVDPGIVSVDGFRYAICFVDAATRYLAVYYLKTKSASEVLEALKRFEREHRAYLPDGHVKRWHMDNGGEFESDDIRAFCDEMAIRRTFSVPYAPPQNGQAERIWGILLRRMRTFHAAFDGTPDNLWTYSMRQSAWLHNTLPSKVLDGKISPYQAVTGRTPSLSMVRVMFCKVFYLLPDTDRPNKIAPRAVEAIHLGTDPSRNGWLVYIPCLDRYTSATHVNFSETEGLKWDPTKVGTGAGDYLTPKKKRCRHPGCKLDEHDASIPHSANRPNTANFTDDLNFVPFSKIATLNSALTSGLDSHIYTGSTVLISRATSALQATDEDQLHSAYAMNVFAYAIESTGPIPIPKTYEEAMASRWAKQWKEAMEREMQGLMENNTWTAVDENKLKGRRPIKSKWVYTVKYNRDGTVERFKARFVACGYSMIQGIDYDRSFSATLRSTSFRMVCGLAAREGFTMEHLDVKNAFVQSEIDEGRDVYVSQAKGFETKGPDGQVQYYKLLRALYGTMQAGRLWQKTLGSALEDMSFKACPTDPCLYRLTVDGITKMILAVYVDDIICLHKDEAVFNRFLDKFKTRFTANYLGKLDWFLHIGIDQGSDGVCLSQKKYIEDLVDKFLPNASSVNVSRDTPCTPETFAKICEPKDDVERERAAKLPYLQIIGSLLYISTMTRPDISYHMSVLCQFMHDPSVSAFEAAQNVLLYLHKTRDMKLRFDRDLIVPEELSDHRDKIDRNYGIMAYSDASWGVARPIYGYCVFMNNGPIAFVSKKLRSADSSCEAEYAAANHCAKELTFIRNLMDDLGFPLSGPLLQNVDNTAAIDVAEDIGVSARTKHFERVLHYLREQVASLRINLNFVRTHYQRADIFTKALDKTTYLRLRNWLLVA